MRAAHSTLLVALLLLLTGQTSAGKVKQAIFGALFGSSRKPSASDTENLHTDADQAELVEWLKKHGYSKYATKEYIEKFDDELAYDSIEDLTHLVADDDYSEIGMDKAEAEALQTLARKEMLTRFLKAVPLPKGAKADVYTKLLDPLMTAGYDEPDDVADLDEEEATGFGINAEETKMLVTYAEAYDARELLHVILTTHKSPHDGSNPFASEKIHLPIIEAILDVGIRTLEGLANVERVPGVSAEDLEKIQSDDRVLGHKHKQEL